MKFNIHDIAFRVAVDEDFLEAAEVFAASWKAAYRGIVDDEYLSALTADNWYGRLCSGFSEPEQGGAAQGAEAATEPDSVQPTQPTQPASPSPAPAYQCLIAHDSSRILGAAVVGKSKTEGFPDDGEITAIYLLPEFIGSGLGHPFIEHCEKVLSDQGYSYIVLDVFAANTRAQKFYASHGYTVVAKDRRIKIDEKDYSFIIMRKHLG